MEFLQLISASTAMRRSGSDVTSGSLITKAAAAAGVVSALAVV